MSQTFPIEDGAGEKRKATKKKKSERKMILCVSQSKRPIFHEVIVWKCDRMDRRVDGFRGKRKTTVGTFFPVYQKAHVNRFLCTLCNLCTFNSRNMAELSAPKLNSRIELMVM
jgi:hypothetical protein